MRNEESNVFHSAFRAPHSALEESLHIVKGLAGDLLIHRDRLGEGQARLVFFVGGQTGAAYAPELLDDADAPERAALRRANRLAVHDYRDRIGVQSRALPHRHPAPAL